MQESELEPVGVIHGRFQVLHNDHLRYLEAGKARCRHLVVGITNPDPTAIRAEAADPHRSEPSANPLSYYQRYRLVDAALGARGLGREDFSIVPFPIHDPGRYGHYVPLDALFFLTIYDAWGEEKLRRFRRLGLRTEVLWRRRPEEKGVTAAQVRCRIAAGEPWEELVPPAVARIMVELGMVEKVRGARA
jgi:nicotinamide-nucleotide adenylyltransferase